MVPFRSYYERCLLHEDMLFHSGEAAFCLQKLPLLVRLVTSRTSEGATIAVHSVQADMPLSHSFCRPRMVKSSC